MRIETLRFDNINSLGGHFEVDFTHPSLADGGIFVITGPTGSGKTSLLDAITYALYAQTARQGRLTAASNEIITHGARFCRAEVVVEKDGRRYLFSTEQRRKKTRSAKADPYTTAERRASLLAADGSATLLSADVNGVRQVVEGLMKYENFCRCMMLAQGDFARFLKAGAAERSEALATITGTEIYQRIGEKVQERLAALRAAIAAVALLPTKDAAARAEAEQRRDAQELLCRQQQAELEALGKALAWHESLGRARRERHARQEAQQKAAEALRLFEEGGQRERIRRAEAALLLRPLAVAREATARELADTRARRDREQEWLRAHPGTGLQEAADQAAAELSRQQEGLERQLTFLADTVQPLEAAISQATIRTREAEKNAATRRQEAEEATAAARKATHHTAAAQQAEKAAAEALAALPPTEAAEQAWQAAQARAELAYKIQSISGKLEELYREFCAGSLKSCPCCGSPQPHKHPQQNAGELAEAQQEARRLAAELRALQAREQAARTTHAAARAAHKAAQQAERTAANEAAAKATLHQQALAAATEARQAQEARQRELAALWQGGSARDEEKRLRHTLSTLQQACHASRDALHRHLSEQRAHAALAQEAAGQLPLLEKQLAERKATYATALAEHHFADEAACRSASLPAEALNALRREQAALTQSLAAAEGALAQATRHEEELLAHAPGSDTAEELAARQQALAQLHHEQKELLTATLAELRQDDDARRANAEKEAELAGTRAELAPWQRLYEILGNARDGFKKYAQRLTFNLLLREANAQLRRLTERYTLLQDTETELGLRVIDRYQDDERGRACSNLSGGESFIVSLALALGLSRMTGETRIDTLFLDEGFGTLDEDALEQVLHCLQSLRAGGKLIGIISHVGALRERIPAHLELRRCGTSGLSTLAPHAAVVVAGAE